MNKYFVLLACFIFSCSSTLSIKETQTYNPDLKEKLIHTILDNNKKLQSFKGIADLKLTNNGRTNSVRIAWASIKMEKIRMEILNPSGHLLSTLASDGNRIYLLDYLEKKYYLINSDNYNLKKILMISLKTKDIIYLLSGGLYCTEDELINSEIYQEENGYSLVTRNRLRNLKKRIYFDFSYRIYETKIYNISGDLSYTIKNNKFKSFNNIEIPAHQVLSNDISSIDIKILKLFSDSDIQEEIFKLTSPHGW